MPLQTLKVFGVNFDVYYEAEYNKDPLGTGDSPAEITVEISEIECGADTQNLIDVLSSDTIEKIRQEIIKVEFEDRLSGI